MKHELRFDRAIELLRRGQHQAVEQLRSNGGDEAARQAKRQLDLALRCLDLCERYQIDPKAKVTTVPWPAEAFGTFEVFDVGEDGLAERPLIVDGQPLELAPGELIIHLRHVLNLESTPGSPPSA